MTKTPSKKSGGLTANYDYLFGDIATVIDEARKSAVRSINCIMTAAYWMIGRRIVEFEQEGKDRAQYGTELLERLAADLTTQFGRGFSRRNLQDMRLFYLAYPPQRIWQTVSAKSRQASAHPDTSEGASSKPSDSCNHMSSFDIVSEKNKRQTVFAKLDIKAIAACFPLPWSAYVRLLAVKNEIARGFYETEALRGGWSVRQLDRQINSQFYERTALSRNKSAVLTKGQKALPEDLVTPEAEIKDPFVLEFLDLKDEYSETDLEEALIRHLETFLLELGGDFCFIGRQKRLRISDEWYRVDLVFFHRRLRCLVIIDLKLGKFTHADAGQMHLYLNYARQNWMHEGENPPVGLILCARKDEAMARYALEGLPNKVMASEYLTALPDEKKLAAEIERTQAMLAQQKTIVFGSAKKPITIKGAKEP